MRSARVTSPGTTSPSFSPPYLARTRQELGELDAAEAILDEVVAGARDTLGESDGRTAIFLSNHGAVLLELGRAADAHDRFEEALAIAREALPQEHPGLPELLVGYGRSLMALERPSEAKSYLREALELLRESKGEADEATRAAAAELERCEEALRAAGG